MKLALFWLAGAASLVAVWSLWQCVQERIARERAAVMTGIFVGLGVAAGAMAVATSVHVEGLSVAVGLPEATGFAALLIELIYLIGLWRHGVQGLGIFVLPLVALGMFVAPLLPEGEAARVAFRSPIEVAHVLLSLAGYALLAIAAGHAAMQLWIDHALKHKRLGRLAGMLPALVEIERHLVAQLVLATVLVGASVLTGLMWQWEVFGRLRFFDHKVLFSLFGFGVLVLMLAKRQRARWSAATTSKVTLAAFAVILFAYFGVRFIHNLIHG